MLLATVVACCAGVTIGLVRRGHLAQLAQLPIRLAWLAALAWLVQVVLFVSPLAGLLDPFAAAIHLTTIVLLGVVIVANRALPGLALLGLGLALNAAVYAANGGFMPVSAQALVATGNTTSLTAMQDGSRFQKTVLQRSDTPLWFLGDILPLPPAGKIYSIGDLVASVGIMILIAQGMVDKRPPPARERTLVT